MRKSMIAFLGVLALAVTTGANADEGARLVPDSAVTLRIVDRQGDDFVVDVTNPTDDVATFNRVGLYFVPTSAPDESPQRLGVVDGNDVSRIAPHATTRFTLTGYCLDEHRPGPGKASYVLANRRMPTSLTNALANAAKTRDPQRAIWEVRAKTAVPLIGDGRANNAAARNARTAQDRGDYQFED